MTNDLVKHWRPFSAAVERYLDGLQPGPGVPGPAPASGPGPAPGPLPPLKPPLGVKYQFSGRQAFSDWAGRLNVPSPLPAHSIRRSVGKSYFNYPLSDYGERPSMVTEIRRFDPQWEVDIERGVTARRLEYAWSPWRFDLDQEGWAGASFLLPRSMLKNTGTSIFQLHNHPARGVFWNLHVADGRLKSDSKDFAGIDFNDRLDGYVDRWVDMVVHFLPTAGGDGFIRMWLDGDLVLDYYGQTSLSAVQGPYFKHGLYFWGYDRFGDRTGSAIVAHDNLRIADHRGSFEMVDPAKWWG